MIFHISPLLSMGPFLWAWHPISTAAVVQCPPIAGNGNYSTGHRQRQNETRLLPHQTRLLLKCKRGRGL